MFQDVSRPSEIAELRAGPLSFETSSTVASCPLRTPYRTCSWAPQTRTELVSREVEALKPSRQGPNSREDSSYGTRMDHTYTISHHTWGCPTRFIHDKAILILPGHFLGVWSTVNLVNPCKPTVTQRYKIQKDQLTTPTHHRLVIYAWVPDPGMDRTCPFW